LYQIADEICPIGDEICPIGEPVSPMEAGGTPFSPDSVLLCVQVTESRATITGDIPYPDEFRANWTDSRAKITGDGASRDDSRA